MSVTEMRGTTDPARLARQTKLAEVGEAGQARLAAATARVPLGDGLEGFVAEAYARRAGFGAVEEGASASADVPAFVLDEAARAVVAGSLAALREIRHVVLGGTS